MQNRAQKIMEEIEDRYADMKALREEHDQLAEIEIDEIRIQRRRDEIKEELEIRLSQIKKLRAEEQALGDEITTAAIQLVKSTAAEKGKKVTIHNS